MSTKYVGGCHCGEVRYSCDEKPEFTFYCHCSDCQKTTGSPFSVELMIPSKSFEIHGKLGIYTVTGDSGKPVHRNFCPSCGSGIFLDCKSDPGYIFLKAGTLDDANWVEPEMHIYTAKKQPWIELGDELPRYEKLPDE